MEYPKIKEACFNLATSMMWTKDALTNENIAANMSELSELSDELEKIAVEQVAYVNRLNKNNEDIIVRAINYINRVHAIPPCKGNYFWFYNTLNTLLEVVCPNSYLEKENIVFLTDMLGGIQDSIVSAMERPEEDL